MDRFQSLVTLNRLWNDDIRVVTSSKVQRGGCMAAHTIGQVVRKKPLIRVVNITDKSYWCNRVSSSVASGRILVNNLILGSLFCLCFNDRRMIVWCLDGEALEPKNIPGINQTGTVSAIVWGCITYYGVEQLVVVMRTSGRTYVGIH